MRLAPDPEKIIFEIEEVLDERISKEDGKPQILVKYLYYPCKLLFNLIVCKLGLIKIINKKLNSIVFFAAKFNQWIAKSNIVIDNTQ